MIAFDLQALQSEENSERGIARYVTELARALSVHHPGVVDWFLWNDLFPYPIAADALELGDRLVSFSDVRGERVDVLHVNSPFEVPRGNDLLAPVRAERLVVTCYDLIPWLFPESYLARAGADGAYRRRLSLIAGADAVVTDSSSAGDDVVRLLGVDPRRVTVIGAGVSAAFVRPDTTLADRMTRLRAAIPSLRPRYVLVPTAADWRKNSLAAIRAYAALPGELRDHHQMVMFCRLNPEQRELLDDLIEELAVTGQVIITGYVPDDVLVPLYQSAELVMYPTVYEGFGLPVLEARRCGARVICSNSSSLPEVLVDARARFSPYETDVMTDLMQRGLTDHAFMAMLDAVPDPGFTWHEAARRLVGVYERLTVGPRPRSDSARAAGRPRVAVVGAFSTHDPADDQARALIRGLDARDDIELTGFSPGPRIGIHAGWRCDMHHLSVLPYHWEATEFDAVVYLLTEGDDQRPIMLMLASVPGHAVLAPEMFEARRAAALTDEDHPGIEEFANLVHRVATLLVTSDADATLLAEVGVDGCDVGDPTGPPGQISPDRLVAAVTGARSLASSS